MTARIIPFPVERLRHRKYRAGMIELKNPLPDDPYTTLHMAYRSEAAGLITWQRFAEIREACCREIIEQNRRPA